MSSEGLHESREELPEDVIDRHRAIISLMEELEAVDWYDQRIAVCKDEELRKILEHNRDEEKEHAAMVLEWIRRHDSVFDKELRTYLFTEGSIMDVEDDATGGASGGSGAAGPGGINLGNLKGHENT